MSYAEVNGTILIRYPYTFDSLKEENPYTNYGDNQDVAFWFPQTNIAIEQGYTLAQVEVAPAPPYDPTRQNCTQNQTPDLINSQWVLGWTVTDFTPEQQENYNNQQKQVNKDRASTSLSNTDWTAIPSVADPEQSNPYLANQAAFLEYRNQLRAIAVNPPVVVESWPVEPDEVWETVP